MWLMGALPTLEQESLAPCVSEKTRSEVIQMEAMESNVRPASRRQLAYIRRLKLEMGEEQPEISEELSVSDASELITELIAKAQQNGHPVAQRKINEPRLGMAMKESFRLWTGLGRSIHKDNRTAFVDYTIETYNLFTEIAEKLEQEGQAQ